MITRRVTSEISKRWRQGLRPWRAWRSLRHLRGVQDELTQAMAIVRRFDEDTTSEFTSLTDALVKFDEKLSVAVDAATKLDQLLQDREQQGVYASAFGLFRQSVDLAHASIGIALSQEEEMAHLEGDLCRGRNQFWRNSLMFRVLVLNIRAEAARISAEDRGTFLDVAAEMAAMEQQLATTVGRAFDELEAIVVEAATGRTQLQSLEADLHTTAQESVALLRAEVEGVQHRLHPCVATNQEILRLMAETRTQVRNLIVALQFQDIVRQQLDHIGQGFGDISGHLAAVEWQQAVDLAYVAHAARVQHAHLTGSQGAIEQASQQIDAAGRSLLQAGSALVDRFGEMVSVARGVFGDVRLEQLFASETANLVEISSQSEATSGRISVLLDRIERSVRVFSTEIAQHEIDVQMVALNAQIAAARIPSARALDKLAEETAQVARDTADLTRDMNRELKATLARLETMRGEADQVRATIGRDRGQLEAGSRTITARLEQLKACIFREAAEVEDSVQEPYRLVEAELNGLQFPGLIAPCFAPAAALCETLMKATAAFAEDGIGALGADRLAAHRERYTMKEEREAHGAVLGPASEDRPPVDVASVELFGGPVETDIAAGAPEPAAAQPAQEPAAAGSIELF